MKPKDRITLKSDLVVGDLYGNFIFTKDMEEYKGEHAIVSKVLANGDFKIVGSNCIFTYAMICGFKTGDADKEDLEFTQRELILINACLEVAYSKGDNMKQDLKTLINKIEVYIE